MSLKQHPPSLKVVLHPSSGVPMFFKVVPMSPLMVRTPVPWGCPLVLVALSPCPSGLSLCHPVTLCPPDNVSILLCPSPPTLMSLPSCSVSPVPPNPGDTLSLSLSPGEGV